MLSNRKKGGRAFSYIEIITVATVIGIVVGGMAVPAYRANLEKGRGQSCHSNLLAIEAAKDKFFLDNPDRNDATVAELKPYFPDGRIPTCPSRPESSYLFQTDDDGNAFLSRDTFVQCGEDGMPGAAGAGIEATNQGAASGDPVLQGTLDGLHDVGYRPSEAVSLLDTFTIEGGPYSSGTSTP
jgi:Tfp pilus assembly protein PilE